MIDKRGTQPICLVKISSLEEKYLAASSTVVISGGLSSHGLSDFKYFMERALQTGGMELERRSNEACCGGALWEV